MKSFASLSGLFTTFLLALGCLILTPAQAQAQTIPIDSTFYADGEIFPFSPNDTIYGLSISGHVTLQSDTSLVRVILTDHNGQEWMAYEAYPMIVENNSFTFIEECDETCYLNGIIPNSIQVQVSHASFQFNSININEALMDGIENLIIENALYKDSLKIEAVKSYIDKTHMPWAAGPTELSIKSYAEKKNLFGNKYKLFGYDYYIGGIYNPAPFIPCIKDISPMVNKFDWREKHNAHLDDHPYHDFDPDQHNYCHNLRREYGNGWMTMVKNQDYSNPSKCYGECDNGCYLFSSLGVMEAVANLYFNHHYDLDLSEQYAMDCTNQSCYNGGIADIFYKATIEAEVPEKGIIDENSLPWADDELDCDPDIDFNYKLSIDNWAHDEITGTIPTDSIKKNLLAHGPLKVALNIPGQLYHDIVLVGYGILNEDDVFYNWDGTIVLEMKDYPQYIGSLYWICKNSYGPLFGDDGYFYFINIYDPNYYYQIKDYIYVIPPVYIDDHNPNSDYERHCFDHDKDGYYNWGLGEFDPMLCDQLCENLNEDSNDDNDTIGPYDDFYIGKRIKPEMQVYLLPPQSVTGRNIINNSFFSFSDDDLDAVQLNFYVENTGDAQLNLRPWGWGLNGERPVEIIEINGGSPNFSIDNYGQPRSMVCMDNKNFFKIEFTGHNQGELAKIKIYLDENGDIPDFEFVLVYNDCQPEHDLIEIAGDQRWDSFALKTSDYLILPGATLTVTSEVAMGIDADILIAHDGKLIIDGGRLTSACSDFWNGIDVWGDASKPQVAKNQGTVEIKNGGMIENADTAIATVRFINIYHYPSGGIIACKDAIFRNNLCDVVFYPYNNIHPVSHEIIGNISRFTRTSFETTDDFYDITHSGHDAHIKLDGIRGIRMAGCDFYNSSTQKDYSRGIGIESNNSGYIVDNYCTEDIIPCLAKQPCTFKNLDYGIRAFNTNGYFSITIDSADFIHNLRGIHLVLVENPTIIKCLFEVSDPEGFWPGEELAGLYLDQFTTGFLVEENIFTGPPASSSTVGIQLLNTGTESNEIYNNSFSSLYHGISAAGVNRLSDKESEGVGLCIKCNGFQQCLNDVYVTYETDDQGNPIYTENTGIAQKQGVINESGPPYDNTLAAGNTFSDATGANFFNNEHCGQIEYVHHGNNFTGIKIIPYPIWGIDIPMPDNYATYTKSGSCPSNLIGSITPSLEKIIFSTETSLISAYKDTILMVIDGGNTEGLNLDIITSYPEEALVIRQELIDESPYLSDTVMISAIEKEDVLPGAMIRDVLVQNPQAPKSKKVMDALGQRQDSIPDYMMEEILRGLNIYGAKELLEQELGSHIAKRDQAWKNLNLFYKNDTSNISGSIDSLIQLRGTDNRLSARYDLAFMYLYVEDSINTFTVLDDIPSEFDLNDQEATTRNHYMDLFNILWDVRYDTTGLDSLQIQQLFSLANSYQTIPGLYASNLLIKERLLNYNEPVYLADLVKNIPDQPIIQEAPTDSQYLNLFPNPAGHYFIAYYFLNQDQYPGMLALSDIHGIELKTFRLKDKQNQIVIPTHDLSAGVYIVSLIARKHRIDSQKVTIIK